MNDAIATMIGMWFEEVWNQRRADTIERLMAEDCLTKVEGLDEPLTREAFMQYHRAFLSAVPDLRAEVSMVVVQDQQGVASWRARGTHLGPGLGIPPSGRPVDFTGVSVFHFENGHIARGYDRWNRGEMIASLMQIRIDELRQHAGPTKREGQVALLMAERFTHVEIAGQLNIRPNTARRHCEQVLLKLGVRSRHDVAAALGRVPGSVLNRHGSDLEGSEQCP